MNTKFRVELNIMSYCTFHNIITSIGCIPSVRDVILSMKSEGVIIEPSDKTIKITY